MDKSSLSKYKFPDIGLPAWKLTKFLLSFIKPWVSFASYFASPFSAMTQNSSEMFQPKHQMLWTKRANQSTNFQTFFECSSCHFWNHKVKVYSNFASLFNVMKNYLYLLAQTSYTLEKKKSEISVLWVFGWKFTKFLSYIWSLKSVFP